MPPAPPSRSTPSPARRRVRGHLRLMRLPLAATTVADIWAGYVGLRGYQALSPERYGTETPLDPATLLYLHAAALALYAAGMTLNDAFDARRDASLYPDRPIPSGEVAWRAAAGQGALLLAVGVGAAWAAGPTHALIALAIAGAVLLYDGLLKRWALPGAAAMGLIRYLDVQLGAGWAVGWAFAPAVVLGLYTLLLTLASTYEETPQHPRALRTLTYGLCGLLATSAYQYPHYLLSVWPFALLACLVTLFGLTAARRGTRAAARNLTLVLLLGIFFVDAGALAGVGRWGWALGTAALAGSFFVLRRLVAGPPPRRPRAASTHPPTNAPKGDLA